MESEEAVKLLCHHLVEVYQQNLVSVVWFGSTVQGTDTVESDIDVLVVCRAFLEKRLARRSQFHEAIGPLPSAAKSRLVTILLTPDEAARTRPYYLGILTASRILFDRDRYFAGILERLRARLEALHAEQRHDSTGASYWILKQPYRLGEEVKF